MSGLFAKGRPTSGLVTVLAALALAVRPAPAEAPQPTSQSRGIIRKTREAIAVSLAEEAPPGTGVSYEMIEVRKDGQRLVSVRNMELDAKTGQFRWLPTESQAGEYDLSFRITGPAPEPPVEITRHVVVRAG